MDASLLVAVGPGHLGDKNFHRHRCAKPAWVPMKKIAASMTLKEEQNWVDFDFVMASKNFMLDEEE